jgi:hypothetical protein
MKEGGSSIAMDDDDDDDACVGEVEFDDIGFFDV